MGFGVSTSLNYSEIQYDIDLIALMSSANANGESSGGEDCTSATRCSDAGGEPSGDGYDGQGNGPHCCTAMTIVSGKKKK